MNMPRPVLPGSAALLVRWALLLSLGLLAACSSEAAKEAVATCVPGKVDPCACHGSGQGTQACLASGTWGGCEGCADAAPVDAHDGPDALKDVAAPDAASDTGGWVETLSPDGSEYFEDGWSVSDVLPEGADASHSCEPCGHGSLRGLVCAPNAQTYVAHALVIANVTDCDGVAKQFQTYTDTEGYYHFPELPCGVHEVIASAGSFSTTYTVAIEVDQETDMTGIGVKQCFKAQDVKIAVLWGQWDDLQELLYTLGFSVDYYFFKDQYYDDAPWEEIEAYQLLSDTAKLAEYDILFFNCGSVALQWVTEMIHVRQNVESFVLNGGSIWASDLSWAYIEGAFPDAIDFWGDTDLPDVPMADDGPQNAEGNQTVPATVVDPILQTHLGVVAFDAEYGAGPLIHVTEAGPGTTVHVTGMVKVKNPNAEGLFDPEFIHVPGPLVLSFTPAASAGRVVYTTFHNDEQADALILKILYYLVFLL
jgi:hypothetical protein